LAVNAISEYIGIHARLLGLLPKDVETRSEAHSVAEIWLPEFETWVIADAQVFAGSIYTSNPASFYARPNE